MTCDVARKLLLEQQEGLLQDGRRHTLRAHLDSCAACRAEEAALRETYTALAVGVHAMTDQVTPSSAFWQSLNAGLDAVDAERRSTPARRWTWMGAPMLGRGPAPRHARPGRRRIAAGVLLAALVSGALVSGAPQQAWASLRHWLYFVPLIGVGQVEPTALVSAAPVAAGNGALTLTVTGLVSGRHAALLSYSVSGPALAAPNGGARVADAVDAVLIGAHGRRYVVTSWLPIHSGLSRDVPWVSGMLAFRPLDPGERAVQLVAARMPLAPPARRPWSLRLALRTAAAGAAQTSLPIASGDQHAGIRVAVTDVTFLANATVVDMDTAIRAGRYADGAVVSLAPEQSVGDFTPLLSVGHGAVLTPAAPLLPAPVRRAVLPRPEFIYGPIGKRRTALSLTVPAVGVRVPGSIAITVRAGMRPTAIALGPAMLFVVGAAVVTPPAALGLDGERRLRITLAFPPPRAGGTLESVDVVVDGVSRHVGRDNPAVEIPLAAGQQALRARVEGALVAVRGPWIIALPSRGNA